MTLCFKLFLYLSTKPRLINSTEMTNLKVALKSSLTSFLVSSEDVGDLKTPESMTDAIAEISSSPITSEEEIAEGGGEAPASVLEAAGIAGHIVSFLSSFFSNLRAVSQIYESPSTQAA